MPRPHARRTTPSPDDDRSFTEPPRARSRAASMQHTGPYVEPALALPFRWSDAQLAVAPEGEPWRHGEADDGEEDELVVLSEIVCEINQFFRFLWRGRFEQELPSAILRPAH